MDFGDGGEADFIAASLRHPLQHLGAGGEANRLGVYGRCHTPPLEDTLHCHAG